MKRRQLQKKREITPHPPRPLRKHALLHPPSPPPPVAESATAAGNSSRGCGGKEACHFCQSGVSVSSCSPFHEQLGVVAELLGGPGSRGVYGRGTVGSDDGGGGGWGRGLLISCLLYISDSTMGLRIPFQTEHRSHP